MRGLEVRKPARKVGGSGTVCLAGSIVTGGVLTTYHRTIFLVEYDENACRSAALEAVSSNVVELRESARERANGLCWKTGTEAA